MQGFCEMAMAPIRGRIASSFLAGFTGARYPGSRSMALRKSSRAQLLLACRGQFSVSAYRNAKAATDWEESAEIYFGGKDSGSGGAAGAGVADSKPTETNHQLENQANNAGGGRGRTMRRNVRFSGKAEEWGAAPKAAISDSRQDDRGRFSSKFSRNSGIDDDNRDGWGVPRGNQRSERFSSKNDSEDHEEEFDDREFDEERTRRPRALPPGMRRLRRGYGRNDARRYHDPREENDRPSEIPPLQGEPLYGVGPIRAALQSRRRDLFVLYVQQGLDENHPGKRKAPADVIWILKNARRLELRIETTSKHVLNMLVDSRPHQGLVLDASALEMVDISALESPGKIHGKAPVWVALDEVKDPQNFGAILRTSYFFGVTGVVVCAKNSAPLSGVVSKASAGALEMIDLLSCKNMMMFLRDSADNGWRILGTSNSSDSVLMSDLPKNLPTILVLGNEGVGIRPFVKAACNHMVRIPGALPLRKSRREKEVLEEEKDDDEQTSDDPCVQFKTEIRNELQKLNAEVECFLRPGTVDSLNVSVAAGVLLNDLINFSSAEEEKSQLLPQ